MCMKAAPTLPVVDSFASEAESVLSELRASLGAIFDQFEPGIARPSELRRRLNLDPKLSWSIFHAVHAQEPHELPPLLPGWRAISRFFEAAEREGVSEQTVSRARLAFQQFEETARRHAADRDTFDAMVSALVPLNDDLIDERLRKRIFTDQSILWGVRTKISFLCLISHPSETPGCADEAMIMGSLQLQQLRDGQPIRLQTSAVAGKAADASTFRDPLAHTQGEGKRSPLVLLNEFCSGPPPLIETEKGGIAGEQTVLRIPGLGRAAAVDLVMTQVTRETEPSAEGTHLSFAVPSTPTEVLYCDLLLPVGASVPHTVRARVFANRTNMARVYERHAEDLLPMRVEAVHCGRTRLSTAHASGKLTARSPLVMPGGPRYLEVVRHIVQTLGWSKTEYDVYRCCVRYPILHALVEMLVDRAPE